MPNINWLCGTEDEQHLLFLAPMFDPESLPSWLNDECYSNDIQPKVKRIMVRELAASIGVSKPYAAQIRSGKVRPHPRHWQKLAEIVGVSG